MEQNKDKDQNKDKEVNFEGHRHRRVETLRRPRQSRPPLTHLAVHLISFAVLPQVLITTHNILSLDTSTSNALLTRPLSLKYVLAKEGVFQ